MVLRMTALASSNVDEASITECYTTSLSQPCISIRMPRLFYFHQNAYHPSAIDITYPGEGYLYRNESLSSRHNIQEYLCLSNLSTVLCSAESVPSFDQRLIIQHSNPRVDITMKRSFPYMSSKYHFIWNGLRYKWEYVTHYKPISIKFEM